MILRHVGLAGVPAAGLSTLSGAGLRMFGEKFLIFDRATRRRRAAEQAAAQQATFTAYAAAGSGRSAQATVKPIPPARIPTKRHRPSIRATMKTQLTLRTLRIGK